MKKNKNIVAVKNPDTHEEPPVDEIPSNTEGVKKLVDELIDKAIDEAIKETPMGESKTAAIIKNIKVANMAAKEHLKSLTSANVAIETDEVAAFWVAYPTAKTVLKVGDSLFLSYNVGAARDFALRNGLEVETVAKPNMANKADE